jgi:hypothetical protein
MTKDNNNQRFWKGTCSHCGATLTMRNSKAIDNKRDGFPTGTTSKGKKITMKGKAKRICKGAHKA